MKPWVAFIAGATFAGIVGVVALRKEKPVQTVTEVVSKPVVWQEVAPQSTPLEVPRVNPSAPAPSRTPTRTVAVAPRPKPIQSSVTAQEPPPQLDKPAPATPSPAASDRPVSAAPPSDFPATRAVSEPVRAVQPKPEPHRVTVAGGTTLTIRLAETISTEKQQSGQAFKATLDQPLIVDGFVIAERGARVEGRVVDATQAGRVKGTAHLSLELTRIHTSDGQAVPISTGPVEREGEQTRKNDAAKVAGGAAVGAALGAIFGGGKGAAVGAASGGAAGGGVVLATRGKDITLPVESRLTFRVSAPVTITEKF